MVHVYSRKILLELDGLNCVKEMLMHRISVLT